jgi:hypothetical protein
MRTETVDQNWDSSTLNRGILSPNSGLSLCSVLLFVARALSFCLIVFGTPRALTQTIPGLPIVNADDDDAVHITASLWGWAPKITATTPAFDGAAGGKVWVYSGVNVDSGNGSNGDLTNPTDPHRIITKPGVYQFRRIDYLKGGGVAPTLEINADNVVIRCQLRFAPQKIIWNIPADGTTQPRLEIYAGQCLELLDPPQYRLTSDGIQLFDTEHRPHLCMIDVNVTGGEQATRPVPGPELVFCTSAHGNIDAVLDVHGSVGNLNGKGGDGGFIAVQAADRDVNLTTPCAVGREGNRVISYPHPPKGGKGGQGGRVGIAGRKVHVIGGILARGGAGAEEYGDGGDGGVISVQAAEFTSTSPNSVKGGTGAGGPGTAKGLNGKDGVLDQVLGARPKYLLPSDFQLSGISGETAWTIMVYIAADDYWLMHARGENEPGLIDWLDRCEKVRIGDKPVKVVVQLDRGSFWLDHSSRELNIPGDASWGNWSNTRRGELVYDGKENFISTVLTPIAGYGADSEANTGEPKCLADFINWAATNYPAANYALLMVGHGGNGILPDYTSDRLSPDSLSLPELRSVFEQTLPEVHVSILSMIACTMQRIEAATELSQRVDYFFSLQDAERPIECSADAWLNTLVAQPGMSAAALAHSIYDACTNPSKAIVDVRAIGNLNSLIAAVVRSITPNDQSALFRARDLADYYQRDEIRDLKQLLANLANPGAGINPDAQRYASLALDYWPKVVLASTAASGGHGQFGGLDLTFPRGYPSKDGLQLSRCSFWAQTGLGKLVDIVGGVGLMDSLWQDIWSNDLPGTATSAKDIGRLDDQPTVLFASLAQGGDKDFLAFTNPRLQQLRICYSGDSLFNKAPIQLSLLGSNRSTVIQSIAVTNNAVTFLSVTNLAAGVYYFAVEMGASSPPTGSDSNSPAFYGLSLSVGDITAFAPKIQVPEKAIEFDASATPAGSVQFLHLANTGWGALTITNFGLATNSSFFIADTFPRPLVIEPSSYLDLPCSWQDFPGCVAEDILHIFSNDPLRPDATVTLVCRAGGGHPLKLIGPKRVANSLTFDVSSSSNQLVVIERSFDLVHWTNVTQLQLTNAISPVLTPVSPTAPNQFFRAWHP